MSNSSNSGDLKSGQQYTMSTNLVDELLEDFFSSEEDEQMKRRVESPSRKSSQWQNSPCEEKVNNIQTYLTH